MVGASGKIDALDITALTINGTLITATPAEINYLVGVTSLLQTQINAANNKTTFSVLNGTQTLTSATIKANHIIDSSGGASDITLPKASTCVVDQIVEFMRSGVNAAGLIANAADQIVNIAAADVATLALAANGSGVVLRCNGTDEWKVIRWIV